ncbi:MAG: hypothetical protein HC809_13240, partial [Gammaproteobacteria bacterium]|nr:hypothetical protein [Gammaproteobacteria bacterium]
MPLNSAMVGRRSRRFRHAVDARWLMAYAAALGETAAHYFDTDATVIGHPLFPVCLEWPVVLDARHLEGAQTLTPAESGSGVHATHDLIIHAPIAAGDEVFTTSLVAGIEQRKPGAYQLTKLETVRADGVVVATTWQGSLFRGVTVVGGDRSVESPPALPNRDAAKALKRAFAVPVAAGAAHVYTECARIWNPIHTDRAVARAAGLPDIILHGTATLALAVSAIVSNCSTTIAS